MIGLMILAVVYGYILFSKFIIDKVYKSYGTKKAKNIALAIMILIPTWDIVFGYPIYKLLCWTSAGVHIYKSVDNVKGFYIGVQEKTPISLPYKGYKYVDYKEKESGKYYRNSWIDNNTSKDCVSYIGAWSYDYTQAFQHGKCIVKKEIPEGEVSRWFENYGRREYLLKIPILKFKMYRFIKYIDRKTGKIMADAIRVWWQGGWVYGIISSIEVGSGGVSCDGNINFDKLLAETLKPKKEK
jgi:hypothetical protein